MNESNALNENFDSRVETLTMLFNRFIEESRKLDPFSVIYFTQPLCDILLRAVSQLQDYQIELQETKD